MSKDNFVIRAMTHDEINIAIDWAAAEGWNPGECDATSYALADPQGFLIGLLNDEPIAVISAMKYDASFGFIGFYIVKPDYRGKGYGYQIWQAAMSYLSGCNIGLDGVVEQQANYQKSGFKLAYRNIRYQGTFTESEIVKISTSVDGDIEAVDETSITQYERDFFPADRDEFNYRWRTQANAHAVSIQAQQEVLGYGVIRACRTGYKIGPLYANDAEHAKALLKALLLKIAKGSEQPLDVFLDTPEPNQAAVNLAELLGMNMVFETARMYTGDSPALPIARTFGVASFEIG
ncbi:GCN5 family acetyltransferase [Pseudoalteromonas luteoviolacea]|uniref:GCN5 family acetyltransferase n=1 Tax=Pseudoalteromonas luteoviolacea TaxID=43657 RepID=A0A0C1QLP2_9GAMM|nr:GNAT family N-acetyltransferase [Pseudoalteromonas luteoviolacea]KID55992.1 GCN5 family acetyltransferase [Pseudoalteromonas luteoviolacea]